MAVLPKAGKPQWPFFFNNGRFIKASLVEANSRFIKRDGRFIKANGRFIKAV